MVRKESEPTTEAAQPIEPKPNPVSAQVDTVEEPSSNGQVPVKNETKDVSTSTAKSPNENSTTESQTEEINEEIVKPKVANLENAINSSAVNGHHQQNGANNLHSDQVVHAHNDYENGAVPNGTLTKDGKKKKKDKEKKTPKKSPRKVLAIITSKDDDERHQAALTHVRPKCCTIS